MKNRVIRNTNVEKNCERISAKDRRFLWSQAFTRSILHLTDGGVSEAGRTHTQALLNERKVDGGNECSLQSGLLNTARRVRYHRVNWFQVVRRFTRVKSDHVARPIFRVIPINLDLAYHSGGHYGRDNQAHVCTLEIWEKGQARLITRDSIRDLLRCTSEYFFSEAKTVVVSQSRDTSNSPIISE